jgi:hypothetical protein
MGEKVAIMGKMRNAYNVFMRKSEGKKLDGRLLVGRKIVLNWVLKT